MGKCQKVDCYVLNEWKKCSSAVKISVVRPALNLSILHVQFARHTCMDIQTRTYTHTSARTYTESTHKNACTQWLGIQWYTHTNRQTHTLPPFYRPRKDRPVLINRCGPKPAAGCLCAPLTYIFRVFLSARWVEYGLQRQCIIRVLLWAGV